MRPQSTPKLAGRVAPLDYARPASRAKGRRVSNLVLFPIFKN